MQAMEEEEKPPQRISNKEEDEEDNLVFPGFRFHPTDLELVGFYLKRKVERKGFSIDIIREIDICKHDPWDLPDEARHVVQGAGGDKDWYFFCLRGRKYRNSIRPNRVTGSGFWKATGIDKPIHDGAGERVGLKKSLVYYRGSAGRGTKTDWMMHEFRLSSTELVEPHDAGIWTICRIFKRNTSYTRRCQQQQQQKQEHGSKSRHHHQQQELQYYYDYYRYRHHHQHHYLHSAEGAYAAAEHHRQPFLLRGFHGSSSSSAETTTMTASSGFVGAPLLPPSTSTSTLGWSDATSLRDSAITTWDELGRILEI